MDPINETFAPAIFSIPSSFQSNDVVSGQILLPILTFIVFSLIHISNAQKPNFMNFQTVDWHSGAFSLRGDLRQSHELQLYVQKLKDLMTVVFEFKIKNKSSNWGLVNFNPENSHQGRHIFRDTDWACLNWPIRRNKTSFVSWLEIDDQPEKIVIF